MEYKSYNYSELENLTKKQKFVVAQTTFAPCTLVSRCQVLLGEFIECYLGGEKDRETLIYDLRYRHTVVCALIESIFEQLCLAEKMLEECQGIGLTELEPTP